MEQLPYSTLVPGEVAHCKLDGRIKYEFVLYTKTFCLSITVVNEMFVRLFYF